MAQCRQESDLKVRITFYTLNILQHHGGHLDDAKLLVKQDSSTF